LFKKRIIIALSIFILLMPLSVQALNYDESYVEYVNNSLIDETINDYNQLVASYSENYNKYVNMHIRSRRMYTIVYAYINKIIGKLQINYDIQKAKERVLKMKLETEISFRANFYNLYILEKNKNNSYDKYQKQLQNYNEEIDMFNKGYIDSMEIRYAKYYKESAYINYIANKRSYENMLRKFDVKIGENYIFNEYNFSIKESIKDILAEEQYISYAKNNCIVLKEYDRQIEKNNIELDYIEGYNLDDISYEASIERLKIDLSLQIINLKKEQYIANLETQIKEQYESLSIQKDEINNYEIYIKICKLKEKENRQFYNNGDMEKEEYQIYKENYEKALITYDEKIYLYNSGILNLEKISCMYMKGEF